MLRRLIFGLSAVAVLAACTHEPYQSGDTSLSYLHTDWVMAKTNGSHQIAAAVTDDGDSLLLSPPKTAAWATVPDSCYRALLYYDRRNDNKEVSAFSIVQVPVLVPRAASAALSPANDPLGLESAWIGKNKKYINLSLILKTGKTSDAKNNRQQIGLVCDSVVRTGSSSIYYIRLLHKQNGVPEYYSAKIYASIPLSGFERGCHIRLSVPTYKGVMTRSFGIE